VFYLGSDSKIVKVDHSGNCSVFTREAKEDGLNWVNGVHVDPVRRTLWACSKDFSLDNADIVKYDLSSGKMIKKYTSPSDGSRHFFNDLVIHPNGEVFISGTAIYRISNHSDTLELFLKQPIVSSNGITLSEDGRIIYAATSVGIYKIDIKTKSFALLTHEEDFNTNGIDGLYFKSNSFYAIQYANSDMFLRQVNRFLLNMEATHVEGCKILEKNTPNLTGPTTGVFVDEYFYFIAGSNQEEVIVMKAHLK
jgi:hypothetical protein